MDVTYYVVLLPRTVADIRAAFEARGVIRRSVDRWRTGSEAVDEDRAIMARSHRKQDDLAERSEAIRCLVEIGLKAENK